MAKFGETVEKKEKELRYNNVEVPTETVINIRDNLTGVEYTPTEALVKILNELQTIKEILEG